MGADDVAILRARHGTDHRTAFAGAGGTPVDREFLLGTRGRMRSDTDVVNPIGTSHRSGPLNGDGPPKQTGLITNNAN